MHINYGLSTDFAVARSRWLPLRTNEPVLLRKSVVIVDQPQRKPVRIKLHFLLMRPLTIGIELGDIGPRPGLVVLGVDLVPRQVSFGVHNFEDRWPFLKGRFVVGQLLSEWIVGAANAVGPSGRVHVVSRKPQYPHDSRGSHRSEDFIESRVMIGVRRLQILDLNVVGLDLVFVLIVVACIEGGRFLSALILLDDDLHVINTDRLTLPAVKCAVRRPVPTLKLHAIAGNLRESVVRTKITEDRVISGEVGKSTLLWLRCIEIRTLGQLIRRERRLIQQNTTRADTRQLLLFRHTIRNFAPVGLRSARGHNHTQQKRQETKSSQHSNSFPAQGTAGRLRQKGLAEQWLGTVARPIGLSIAARSAGFSFHSQRPVASCSRFCLNASTHCRITEASSTPVLKLPSRL